MDDLYKQYSDIRTNIINKIKSIPKAERNEPKYAGLYMDLNNLNYAIKLMKKYVNDNTHYK